MQFSSALTLAAIAVGVSAQGAAIGIAPAGGSPAGCVTTGSGYYQITVVQPASSSTKRDAELESRQLPACGGTGTLVFKLNNGVLTDSAGRIGSIVANRQFQFDGPPPQTGAIYTGGFSICPNTSLAIGPTTNFYQCLSGGFYNLYDEPSESDCKLVNFNTINCALSGTSSSSSGASSSGSTSAASSSAVAQKTDGQPTASSAAVVSQKTDGQPTASSAAPVVSQISDGQPQASKASNATITSAKPTSAVVTGAAAQYLATGAVAALGAAAALFL